MSNIEIYSDGELELKVSINEDTIWLTQKQIAEVFDVNVPAISKHIKNIYKDNELEEFGTISVLEIFKNRINSFFLIGAKFHFYFTIKILRVSESKFKSNSPFNLFSLTAASNFMLASSRWNFKS